MDSINQWSLSVLMALMVIGGWADEDRNGRGFLSGCIQSKRLLHNVTD
jgi:hypothetical protein